MLRFGFLSVGCLSVLFACAVSARVAYQASDFERAEQFVHNQIYNSLVQVWSTERRAWNQLLQVHACGVGDIDQKLRDSYNTLYPEFSDAMLSLAASQGDRDLSAAPVVLKDISQLAYRLFSMSFAHGYARQIAQVDQASSGLRSDLCGGQANGALPSDIAYPDQPLWKLAALGSDSTDVFQSLTLMERHATHGFDAFADLLQSNYARFDALIYSHAYQHTDAYTQLFFEVNGYDKVLSYQSLVDKKAGGKGAPRDDTDLHVDFAYLILSSGYHWGTISVLAMLEEEYPELHQQTQVMAEAHIRRTLEQQEIASEHGD